MEIVCHPDFQLNYSGRQGVHAKEEVTRGPRRAMIDTRLKPLIYQLWRARYTYTSPTTRLIGSLKA
jgi:hypothetical protein